MRRSEYRKYLESEHWKAVRKRYFASNLPQRCFCGATRVDLHHVTYERLGRELLTDLVPLCRRHHDEVHGKTLAKRERKRRMRAHNRAMAKPKDSTKKKPRAKGAPRYAASAAEIERVSQLAAPPADWF